MNRKPNTSVAAQQRAREQQAVLDRLRSGGSIAGAKPANPLIGGIQSLFGGAGAGTIPTLNAAQLGGQEVLMNRGGWSTNVAGSGPINVGGQTWYPAQSGQDLVYKRAPGAVGGQYGSIFSKDQSSPPETAVPPGSVNPPGAQPPATSPAPKLSPEEQAYNQERSRIAQLTAQNPEFQSIGQLRNDLRDQGMAIWAQKNRALAEKVKPGQSGYDAIQKALYPGGTPLPALPAESEAMLNAIAPVDATGIRPNVTPMPGQLPAFGTASDLMYQAVIGNGSAFTPMSQQPATPQDKAQDLAEAFRQAMLARITK
jgi:hypothetical protein